MSGLKRGFFTALVAAVVVIGCAGGALAASYIPSHPAPQWAELTVTPLSGSGYVTPLAFDSERTLQLRATWWDSTSAPLFTNQNLASEFGHSRQVDNLMYLGVADVTNLVPGIPPMGAPLIDSSVQTRLGRLTADLVLNNSLTLSAGTMIVGYQAFFNFGTRDYNDFVLAISDKPLNAAPTPVPGAVWLLGSGLAGLLAFKRSRRAA